MIVARELQIGRIYSIFHHVDEDDERGTFVGIVAFYLRSNGKEYDVHFYASLERTIDLRKMAKYEGNVAIDESTAEYFWRNHGTNL